jgi:phosphatidylglycerophosphate synthase
VSTGDVTAAYIVGDDAVRLWGLVGAERITRQLRAAGVTRVLRGEDAAPTEGSMLVLRSDYLFDDRTLAALLRRPGVVLVGSSANGTRTATAVAANVPCDALAPTCAALAAGHAPALIGVAVESPESLSTAFVRKLHKSTPPVVLPVRAERVAALERHLFDGSYKGVTDLVTKWVWPAPARAVTRVCARLGIPPNGVTAVSFVLVLSVIVLFAQGRFGAGLVLAWIMTFLDTVDGKLARVTVSSTPFGHYFDHTIDSVHPPVWYLAWAFGLTGTLAGMLALGPLLAAIVVFYVAGRLIESTFKHAVGGGSLFTWRPFDSYFRLVMARRNPNLILLTLFFLGGAPRMGLVAVGVWTVLSTIVLAVRLAQGAYARSRHGALTQRLEEIDPERDTVAPWARPFVADLAAVRHLVH